jgi:hypothetical protein
MRPAKSVSPNSPNADSSTITPDRRERRRLRDLCDEVLASFRIAADRDPISEQDRATAMQLLPQLTPLPRS